MFTKDYGSRNDVIRVWRYTTPKWGIRLYDDDTDTELDLSNYEDIRVVLAQDGTDISKSLKDETLTIVDNSIVVSYTQEETAALQEGTAELQCHVLSKDDEAYHTEDIVAVKVLQPVDRRKI